MQIDKFYKNKRIFITGHTGFKGSWLTSCLLNFGAKVMGFSQIDERIKHLVEFSKLLTSKSLSNFTYLDMRFENQIIAKERSL